MSNEEKSQDNDSEETPAVEETPAAEETPAVEENSGC